jgi:hypothetical protein
MTTTNPECGKLYRTDDVISTNKLQGKSDMMESACNPSTWEDSGLTATLGSTARPYFKSKKRILNLQESVMG